MTEAELMARVGDARHGRGKLTIRGGCTKAAPEGDILDMSGFSGIMDYAPGELTLTVGAGTPLAEIETLLGSRQQRLAFDPPFRPPLGRPGRQTIGGVIASNSAGPGRLKGGAPRDHLLGFSAISGHGEQFRAGGKVVKNVTGFDLCKLMAGSRGTLAALTEVTVKVVPAPAESLTLAVTGLEDARAILMLIAAVGSAADVSAAAHVGGGRTAVRLEGFPRSVGARAAMIRASWATLGTIAALTGEEEERFWGEIATAAPPSCVRGPVWRIIVPPAASAAVVAALGGNALYDWGGGLVWLTTAAEAALVHAVSVKAGGHARCMRGNGADAPPDPARAAMAERVRIAFDPDRVFGDR